MCSTIAYFDLQAGRFKSINATYGALDRVLINVGGSEEDTQSVWSRDGLSPIVTVHKGINLTIRATIVEDHLTVEIPSLYRMWLLFRHWFLRGYDCRRHFVDTEVVFTVNGIYWKDKDDGTRQPKNKDLELRIRTSFKDINSHSARSVFVRFILAIVTTYEEGPERFYDSCQESPDQVELMMMDEDTRKMAVGDYTDRMVTGPTNLEKIVFFSRPISIGTMTEYNLLSEGIRMLSHTHLDIYTKLFQAFEKYKVSFYNVLTQVRCLYKSLAIDKMARSGLFFNSRWAFVTWFNDPNNRERLNAVTQNMQRRISRKMMKDHKQEVVELFPHMENASQAEYDHFLSMPNYSILDLILQVHKEILIREEIMEEKHMGFIKIVITPVNLYGGSSLQVECMPPVYNENLAYSGILVFGGHVVPLLASKHTFLDEYRVFNSTEIPPNPKRDSLPLAEELPYFTYDFETFQNELEGRAGFITPYSVQLCFDGTIESSLAFIGEHCISSFFAILCKEVCKRKNPKTILYAHNGAKFDAVFLFSWLVRNLKRFNVNRKWINYLKFEPHTSIIKSGKIISLALTVVSHRRKNAPRYQLIFRDSLQYALGSLDGLGKGYGLPLEKGNLVYEDIKSFKDVEENYAEIQEYGIKDVVILHKIVSCVMKGYKEIAPEFPITGSATISGYAKKIFFDKFYQGDIYRPSDIIQNKIRPYFKGGIVQTGIQGVCRISDPPQGEWNLEEYLEGLNGARIEDRDVTSLYPFVMANAMMPIGKPVELNEDNWPSSLFDCVMDFEVNQALKQLSVLGDSFFVMIEYYHEAYTEEIPFFPVESGKEYGLLRPYIHRSNPQRTMATHFELAYILKAGGLGMKIKLLKEGYMFQPQSANKVPFEKFIRTYFEVKKNAAEAKKTAPEHLKNVLQAQISSAKLIINSFYGGFAMKPVGTTVTFKNDSNLMFERTVETLIGVEDICRNDDDQVMIRYKSLITSKFVNLFKAMTITAIARVVFYSLRKAAQDAGYDFLVGDTDSGYFLADDQFEEKVVQTDKHWKNGKELGGLTSDYPDDIIIACAVVGPKVYAVQLVNKETGEVTNKIKFKGMNQNDCFGKKYEFIDELSGQLSLGFEEHYSKNWFSRKEIKTERLTFEDFCKYAKGEYAAIWVNRFQMRAGVRSLGVVGDKKQSIYRQAISKRYGRTVNKGWKETLPNPDMLKINPRILAMDDNGTPQWGTCWMEF